MAASVREQARRGAKLVNTFFAEGEQLGSNPGSSTSIGLVEEQINTLELELGGILCAAVADAALVPPLRDLTRMVKAPTPQQQAKALVLQRAYRLGAPSRSAQRAAFVRAGLSHLTRAAHYRLERLRCPRYYYGRSGEGTAQSRCAERWRGEASSEPA